jgi:hypothetical protein
VKRRAALCALLGLGSVARARIDDDRAGALAWGDDGVWAADTGAAALQALPDAYPSAAVPPVASARGVWGLVGPGSMGLWQRVGQRWGLVAVADAGAAVHALQTSGDGRFVLAAHGQQLSLFDEHGSLLRRYEGSDLAQRRRGRAAVLRHLPQRRSFVVAWDDLAEWWEISHDPAAAPLYDGLVHDYRMGEAIASRGYLGVRRIPLDQPLAQLGFADARVPWAAALRDGQVQVVHLDVRRRIATWPLPGALLRAALLRREAGGWVWWLPAGSTLQRIDTARWLPLDAQALPCEALALQAVGGGLWLLGTQAGANGLWLSRGEGWRPVPVEGTPRAMQADADDRMVLVLTSQPTRVCLLDREGRLLRVWEAPAALRGVAWLAA